MIIDFIQHKKKMISDVGDAAARSIYRAERLKTSKDIESVDVLVNIIVRFETRDQIKLMPEIKRWVNRSQHHLIDRYFDQIIDYMLVVLANTISKLTNSKPSDTSKKS